MNVDVIVAGAVGGRLKMWIYCMYVRACVHMHVREREREKVCVYVCEYTHNTNKHNWRKEINAGVIVAGDVNGH